jgi:hypothetical protein
MQPQSATPAHASLALAAHVTPSVSTPAANDATNRDAASLVPSPPTSAAAAASGVNSAPTPSAAKAATQAPTPAAATVQEGSRVRIKGLQAAPEMNGRTGVVCGAISQESGRWTVQIDADGARAACRGAFHAANLQVIPSHNFSTEWVVRRWARLAEERRLFTRVRQGARAFAAGGLCPGWWWHAAYVPFMPLLLRA